MGKGQQHQEENPGTKKLLGTFTAPPPLFVGEPYLKKGLPDARSLGKQLLAGPLKHENSKITPGTFDPPRLLWQEQKDKYMDKICYKDVIPPDRKKNGFLSSDYPRRDEFSNTIRTEQIREVLKKETAAMNEKKASLDAAARQSNQRAHNTASQILNSSVSPTKPPLYDVVYRIPEASLKLARDDRQAGLWYKEARQQAQAGTSAASSPRRRLEGAAWVNIALNGKIMKVLVDENEHILSKQDASHSPRGRGSQGVIDFS
eukprot:CAMPEP_0181313004 /NCGR_PEP_ID=MMETSP1101-20121128/14009_1 /TAXON_ID=46948 /ORGANISM="Rhodomonas abbreviata, Strain Caron Lab Isolate" /LENGTH=259 /DNA_ID=CAMNT_0023419913 /DNA_START=93 /DNA_END=872 /DNA_ORIENTATION=-